MRKMIAAFLGVSVLLPAVASAASFDCYEATAPVEHLICNDPVLNDLDERMAEAYAARKATAKDSQRAWLRERLQACGIPAKGGEPTLREQWTTAPCLVGQYRQRLSALGAAVGDVAPPGGPSHHPLCLSAGLGFGDDPPFSAADLRACDAGFAHIPVERGETGAWTAQGASMGTPTWTSAESLATLPDGRESWLLVFGTGGTGVFSAIVATGPQGEEVLVSGGDRCSGGIIAATLGEDAWRVRFNATPADLASVLGVPEEAGADLSYCAVCCAAEVEARYSLDGGEEDVVAVRIEPEFLNNEPTAAERCLLDAVGSEALPAEGFDRAREHFAACVRR